MRRHRSDFSRGEERGGEYFYDVEYDRDLIEASFAAQYGVRLAREADISYAEWARLLRGIMPETPLGRVVAIRAETDRRVMERYGPYERRIRAEWARFRAQRAARDGEADVRRLQEMLRSMFAPEGVSG